LAYLLNGTKRDYCSLKCLAQDHEEYGLDLNKTKVHDFKSGKYINASKAYYLINSYILGTNSAESKLAFLLKKDAIIFQNRYRGEIVSFKKALHLSINSLEKDKIRLNKIYKKKLYIVGKKIFEQKCKQEIDFDDFLEINELKFELKNNFCKQLNEKRLHSVTLYLWDIKRNGLTDIQSETIKVNQDEKCPVCGMFTYKYPRWVAQIYFTKDKKEHHYSFDGVKDMMKFYFNPMAWGNYDKINKNNITKIMVTDYYKQKAIDGKKAFYVERSDIFGPMGNELIPFENKDDAINFLNDHKGKRVIKFTQIKEKEVYKLDHGN
jgi:nitrous oxide reductase accessory protein NosL